MRTLLYFLIVLLLSITACNNSPKTLKVDGGVKIGLEINMADFMNSLCANPNDSIYLEGIAKTSHVKFKDIDEFLAAFAIAIENKQPGLELAPLFVSQENKDKITFNSSNKEVLEFIKSELQKKITETISTITKRLEYSETPAESIKIMDFNTLMVEIPGITDPQRIANYLQSTGHLGFWETFDLSEIYPYLDSANRKITELALVTPNPVSDSINETTSLIDQINSEKNISAEELKKNYPLFKILVLPTNNEYGLQKGPCVGRSLAKDTSEVNRLLNNEEIKLCFPRNLKFCWTVSPVKNSEYFELIALKSQRFGEAVLEGNVVSDATTENDKYSGGVVVMVTMNNEGAKIWGRITSENIGKNIAIVIDNCVYTYPNVMSEIKGGKSSITGNFSMDEAKDLANILKAGRYNSNVKIVSSEIVKPANK